jgi:uncharacterized FlaG/YvyC family protein
MNVEQTLQSEIQDSKRWIECTQDDNTYKRDLKKRIELINWVLEEMKKPDIQICALIESKINELITKINEKDSIFEADPLDTGY